MGLVYYTVTPTPQPLTFISTQMHLARGVWEFLPREVVAMAMAQGVVTVKQHGQKGGAHHIYLHSVGL